MTSGQAATAQTVDDGWRAATAAAVPGWAADTLRRRPLNLLSTSSAVFRVWTDGEPGTGLVLKVPRLPGARHDREVWFYRNVADAVRGLVPRCLAAADSAADFPHLLIADCSGEERAGPSHALDTTPLPAVDMLVDRLARLHVGSADHARTAPVLPPTGAPDDEDALDLLDRLLHDWAADLDPLDARRIRTVAANAHELRRRLGPARTVVHGDLHPLNVLDGTGDPVVIDWQDCHAGHPLLDLAALTGAYVHPLDRLRNAPRWRSRYARTVEACGGLTGLTVDAETTGVAAALAVLLPVRLVRSGVTQANALLRTKHVLAAAEQEVPDDLW